MERERERGGVLETEGKCRERCKSDRRGVKGARMGKNDRG